MSKKAAWKGKSGSSLESLETVGKHGRHRLSRRRYVASFEPAQKVGMLTSAAACDLQTTEAEQQVVLGDGSDWMKTQANEHFPDAVKILDWPHLWRNIQEAVRAVQPGKRAIRRAWRKEQNAILLPLLWNGEREAAFAHLQTLRSLAADALPPLEEAITYLESHREWIGKYARWQEQGLSGRQWPDRTGRRGSHQRTDEKTRHAVEAGQCHCCRGFTRPAHQC